MTFKLFKTILFSLLVIAVALSSTAIAFASDSVEGIELLPDSLLPVTVTDPDIIERDLLMRQLSMQLSAAASDSGTRDVNYAANIYAILYAVYDSGNNRLWVNDYSANNKLTSIINLLTATYATGGSTGIANVVYDIYDVLLSSLISYSPNNNNILSNTYMTRLYISSGLFDSNQDPYLETVTSQLASLSINSANLYDRNHTDLANIYSLINSLKSANHTDLASISSKLDTLTANFNNVAWQTGSGSVILRDKNYNTISAAGSYYPMYFTFTGLDQGTALYRFHIYYTENYGNTNLNLQLGTYANGQFNPMNTDNIFYTYIGSNQGYDVYVYSPSFAFTNYNNQVFTIKVDNGYLYRTTVLQYYLPTGSKDFTDTLSALTSLSSAKNSLHIDKDLHSTNEVLERFKLLYASDDLVAAKQAQQGYEDQAISDFTGSGSAAAGGSDLNGAKQISGSLKNGLSTGVSVSDGLSLFDSGSFWGWFTQTTSDQINNLYIPSRGSYSYDYYDPDLYDKNLNDIFSHMQGDK